MTTTARSFAATFLMAVVLAGCARFQETPTKKTDTVEVFLKQMRAEGVEPYYETTAQSRQLSEPALVYRTAGDLVHVHAYQSEAAAVLDLERLAPNPPFTAPLYRRDNLIVIHFGENPKVSAALEDLLGGQVL